MRATLLLVFCLAGCAPMAPTCEGNVPTCPGGYFAGCQDGDTVWRGEALGPRCDRGEPVCGRGVLVCVPPDE